MFDLGMTKFVALLQFLLALGGCSLGGTTYSNHIANGGHDVLASKARVQDGVARFDCRASDSGWCHYTLYPDACGDGKDCALAPIQRLCSAQSIASVPPSEPKPESLMPPNGTSGRARP